MGRAAEKACFSSPGFSGWMVVTRTSLAMMLLVPSIFAPLMVTPVGSSSQMPATTNSSGCASGPPAQPWGLVIT